MQYAKQFSAYALYQGTRTLVEGLIRAPASLMDYCISQQICPNLCSKNGYCLGGVCHCLPGFRAEDCSVSCPALFLRGEDNPYEITCVDRCPEATYLDKFGLMTSSAQPISLLECKRCDKKCESCKETGENKCLSCAPGLSLRIEHPEYETAGSCCIETCADCV
jgi:hypothetical protein